jgi:hypothetical protein
MVYKNWMDPFAPPESDVAGPSSHGPRPFGPPRFTLPAAGTKWTAKFHDEEIEFVNVDDEHTVVVRRDELPDLGNLVFMPGGAISISIRQPEKIFVRVPKDTHHEMRTWLDPILTDLVQRPARKGVVRNLLFGGFCLLMLVLGDSPIFWILLTGWNVSSIVAGYVRPSRYMFLAGAVAGLTIAGYFTYWAVTDGTWWMYIFVFLMLVGVASNVQRFRFWGISPSD